MECNDAIRNVGIIAHVDAGKTTLTEEILHLTGALKHRGAVDDGTTVSDYLQPERERGISIVSAALTCGWRDVSINLIDTPGHIDFTAEVERALRVMDAVVAVFCGLHGVQAQSEMVWRRAQRYALPALAFVNKLDREGADFGAAMTEMARLFGDARPIALTVPLWHDNQLTILNLLTGETLEGKSPDAESAAAARSALIEQLAELDDAVMHVFLADAVPTAQQLSSAVRRLCISGRIVPVFAGSAATGAGVSALLDGVVDFLPTPSERLVNPAVRRLFSTPLSSLTKTDGSGEIAVMAVMKVIRSAWPGDYAAVRLYTGRLTRGMRIFDANRNLSGRIGALYRLNANEVFEIESAQAGDVIGIAMAEGEALPPFVTGDTLVEEGGPQCRLARMRFPEPVVSVVLAGCSREDRDKLPAALEELTEADPTLRSRVDSDTGQCCLAGVGELHLEVARERLAAEYGVKTRAGSPTVNYRAAIRAAAQAAHEFSRQLPTGIVIQAKVEIALEPLPPGSGNTVEFPAKENSTLPQECLDAVSAAVQESLVSGSPSGFPLTDTRVTVLAVSTDQAEPAEPAFLNAARLAMSETIAKAGEAVLEPVMRLEVSAPIEQIGKVLTDAVARRGRIIVHEALDKKIAHMTAMVPVAELLSYASQLRSLTGGRAEFTAEPACYEEKPTPKQ